MLQKSGRAGVADGRKVPGRELDLKSLDHCYEIKDRWILVFIRIGWLGEWIAIFPTQDGDRIG